MNRSQYPDKIKNLIEICNEGRFANPDRVIESSEELRVFASDSDDKALSGYADFFMADAFFTKYNSAECMKYLKDAIVKLNEAEEWQQLGECYNLYGVLSEQHGIFSAAMDSYIEAINLSRKFGLVVPGTMAYANYSNLARKNGDYESALKALLACRKYSEKLAADSRYDYLRIRIQVNLVKLYVIMQNREYAERELNTLESLYSVENAAEKELDYYYLKLIYSDLMNDSNCQAALRELLEAFLSCRYKVDYLDECLDMMEYFKQKGHYDLMKVVLPVFRKVAKSNDFLNAQVAISSYRIDLLQHEGRWGSLLDEYRHYRELSVQHKKQLSSILKLRSDIKRISGQNSYSDIFDEVEAGSFLSDNEPFMILL